jgi:hypothetical protein
MVVMNQWIALALPLTSRSTKAVALAAHRRKRASGEFTGDWPAAEASNTH